MVNHVEITVAESCPNCVHIVALLTHKIGFEACRFFEEKQFVI